MRTMMRGSLAIAILALAASASMATASPPVTMTVATVSPPTCLGANAVNNVAMTNAPVMSVVSNSLLGTSLGSTTAAALAYTGSAVTIIDQSAAPGARSPGVARNVVASSIGTAYGAPRKVANTAGLTGGATSVAMQHAPEVAYNVIKPMTA